MKKARRKTVDELRSEYRRSDFRTLVRGKYTQRIAEATNIVVLEPEVAKAFPTDRAVNKALRSVISNSKASPRLIPRTRPARRTLAPRPARQRSTPSR
jgi:hypothetical protein